MNEPILKRALAKPPAADRPEASGLGMLGYVPRYQPNKKPMRRAPRQVQQIGGKGAER